MKRTLRHFQAKLGWRHPRPLPHFLVIGTQKGGTTTLHHLLSRHPGIFLPEVKEVHYFSQHFHHNRQWYADHYKLAKPGQVRGDITPFYMFHKAVPERIRSVLPNVRLIALLRDPVERTLPNTTLVVMVMNNWTCYQLWRRRKSVSGAHAVVSAADGFHYSYQKHLCQS